MAKFCSKCGASLEEGNRFCKQCGAPVVQTISERQETQQAMSSHESFQVVQKKDYKILLVPVAAIAVILLCLIIVFGGNGYKKPVSNLEKGLTKCDAATFKSAFCKDMQQYIDTDDEDIKEKLGDYRIKLKIVGKEKLSKDEAESKAEDVGVRGVSAGYMLDVKITASKDNQEASQTINMLVVKQEGQWGLASADIEDEMNLL